MKLSTNMTDGRWRILVVLAALATASFVWFYPVPLAADLPLHCATAQAFLHLISNPDSALYPYVLNLKVSSYAFPEIILALFLAAFGLTIGTKIALTTYALIFAHSVNRIVTSIEPSSRWIRLIGLPLALTWSFHWGFWSTLLGFIVANYAIAQSIRERSREQVSWSGIMLRFLTVLMHPAPALALGIFDVVYVLFDPSREVRWWHPRSWQFKKMGLLWGAAGLFIAANYLGFRQDRGTTFSVQWGDLGAQLSHLIRPLYLTCNPWENAVVLILAGGLLSLVLRAMLADRKHRGLLAAAIVVCLAGVAIPAHKFLGVSGGIGPRIVFPGMIVLFTLIALVERRHQSITALLVVVMFATNLAVGHNLWLRHNESFLKGLSVLQEHGDGLRVRSVAIATPSGPCIMIGKDVAVWAWCAGAVGDAYNAVARVNDFGPVRYLGIDSTKPNEGEVLVLYHPYQLDTLARNGYNTVITPKDSIYGIQILTGGTPDRLQPNER